MHNLVGDKLRQLLEKHSKSIRELAYQTQSAPWSWQKIINGKARLNVDLAIRLGKVFPDLIVQDMPNYGFKRNLWLYLQFLSDKANAEEQDGPMYAKIKPFSATNNE